MPLIVMPGRTYVASKSHDMDGRAPPACFDGPAGCSSDYAQVDEERNTKKEAARIA